MPDSKYFKKAYGYGSRDNPSATGILGTLQFLLGSSTSESSSHIQATENFIIPNTRPNTMSSDKRRSQGYRGL